MPNKSKSSQDQGKKKAKTNIKEVEAMEDLVETLIADDKCKDLKEEAKLVDSFLWEI